MPILTLCVAILQRWQQTCELSSCRSLPLEYIRDDRCSSFPHTASQAVLGLCFNLVEDGLYRYFVIMALHESQTSDVYGEPELCYDKLWLLLNTLCDMMQNLPS